jgi:hypothetical protein
VDGVGRVVGEAVAANGDYIIAVPAANSRSWLSNQGVAVSTN